MNESKDSTLSIVNASGRQVSLLNDHFGQPLKSPAECSNDPLDPITPPRSLFPDSPQPWPYNYYTSQDHPKNPGWLLHQQKTAPHPLQQPSQTQPVSQQKRKYHCTEPGCNKSFTTSGHLARHFRIHTGEKNFPCLFPGCQSRFSRQDNMMQHYRTHMSPKSRKTQKRVCEEAQHPRPRLHAHHRIQSDSYDVERPLTIDQHLNNYHRSLSSRLVKLDTLSPPKQHVSAPIRVLPTPSSVGLPIGFSPLSSRSSSSSISVEEPQSPSPDRLACPSVSSTSTETFFQHRPLTFSKKPDTICTTLLGPTNSAEPASDFPAPALQHEMTTKTSYMPAQLQEQYKEAQQHGTERSRTQDNEGSEIEPSSDGLLQLAHVVSTFG